MARLVAVCGWCIVPCWLLFQFIHADVYLHMPRLFDSQNNNRGGYNVGSTYYYTGSKVTIEWTGQHSCSDPNNHCELILQYMCDSSVRDGATTSTIPLNAAQCANYQCDTDLKYGMHESFFYYQNCVHRERNRGLFTADQRLKGETARYTRQNRAGTRRGYECPEERDYYPYWSSTPWKDIAILTSRVQRCPALQAESENVKLRYTCQVPTPYYQYWKRCKRAYIIPLTEGECKKITWNHARDAKNPVCRQSIHTQSDSTFGKTSATELQGQWVATLAHSIPPPDCREAPWSRDNHLGNGMHGFANMYNWTVPDLEADFCVLRLRYNISTDDYNADSANESLNSRWQNDYPVPLWDKLNMTQAEANRRGFAFKQNPVVQLYHDLELGLRLAVNTNQFGRTFQDRSHTFSIRRRPSQLKDANIVNLQVRGKRGNIVQVYPGVEYDFVPNRLMMTVDDYIHFQWTGSNSNPHNNDGQGVTGSDRHNIVALRGSVYPETASKGFHFGRWGVNYPSHHDSATFLGFNRSELDILAFLKSTQFGGEMSELDDAGTYFDLSPRKVTRSGEFHYMCSRNNNFSNRSQKGKIKVVHQRSTTEMVGWNGGSLAIRSTNVMFPRAAVSSPTLITLETWKETDCQSFLNTLNSGILSTGGRTASDCIVIHPQTAITTGKSFTLTIPLTDGASLKKVRVYQTNQKTVSSWTEVTAKSVDSRTVTLQSMTGGIFVAKESVNVPLIVSIVALCILLFVGILGTAIYFHRYPEKVVFMRQQFSRRLNYAHKSCLSRV